MENDKRELSLEQSEELLNILKARFGKNMNRHKGFEWAKVDMASGGSWLAKGLTFT